MALIRIKRGLAANAGALTLQSGEMALETDTGKVWIGNGAGKVYINPTPADAPVKSVAGKTGAVTLSKTDVGLSNVDNVQQAPLTHVGAGGSSQHPDATTSTSGFMTATNVTKLNGITAGATPNRAQATQAQAEAGTDTATDMSPLRVAQAIAASTIDGGTF